MEPMTTVRGLAAAMLAAALLTGCTQAAADKAGGEATVVTLRLATDDDQGRPGAYQIEHFAAQVAELSGGRLLIEPVWAAAGDDVDDWDQRVARAVIGGEFEMGMVPARAWDTEGVTSMRALHAPLLVTSDELLERVVTDAIVTEMLAGLDGVGVTGLALVPEGLRHLFFFGNTAQPALDLNGGIVRAPTSDTTYATIEALGGKADDLPGEAFDQGIADGSVVAAESSYALANTLPAPTTAVANLTLYPKVNSLVVDSAVFADLTDEQRTILRDAAQRTVDWAVAGTTPDVELAAQYCANGGRIAVAPDTENAGVQVAVQPVLDELARDPGTAAQIERITALRAELGTSNESAAGPCAPNTSTEQALATGEGPFPAGVYRMELPLQALLDAGVDPATASYHDGTWTLSLAADGRADDGTCPGTWTVAAGRLVISFDDAGPDCPALDPLFTAGWRLDGDQLQLLDVLAGTPADQLLIETIFGSQPFTRAA